MNADATPARRKRPHGWRTAVVLYLLVVAAGLGAPGAHALWSTSGTVTSTVSAATWAAPTPGPVPSVGCTRKDGPPGDKSSDITFTWQAVAGTSYTLTATGNGTAETTAAQGQATLRLALPNASGSATYTLTVTPKIEGTAGTPTRFDVVLDHKSTSTVTCTRAA